MSRGKGKGEEEGGFAGRWSRLKREARAPAPEPAAEAEAAPAAPAPAAPAEDTRPDAEVLAELGLPDPETLKPGDDFAAFLAKAAPTRIRNRALRRLWLSDPVLANLDMLVDYGDDFTDAATVVENLQTAYQVGRGYVDRLAEKADELPGEEELPEARPEAETVHVGEEPADPASAEAEPEVSLPPETEKTVEPLADERKPGPRPRMRFRIAED